MDSTYGYAALAMRKKAPNNREYRTGYAEPLAKLRIKKKGKLQKLEVSIRDCGGFIQQRFDEHMVRIKVLLAEFNKEFRPIKGKRGFLLVGKDCGSKECKLCPHSILWRSYDYRNKNSDGAYVFLWADYEVNGLPYHFSKSRSPKVVERFQHYEAQRAILNEQRKKLQSAMERVRAAYMSIERSEVFRR